MTSLADLQSARSVTYHNYVTHVFGICLIRLHSPLGAAHSQVCADISVPPVHATYITWLQLLWMYQFFTTSYSYISLYRTVKGIGGRKTLANQVNYGISPSFTISITFPLQMVFSFFHQISIILIHQSFLPPKFFTVQY